jgi:hypothetical protein
MTDQKMLRTSEVSTGISRQQLGCRIWFVVVSWNTRYELAVLSRQGGEKSTIDLVATSPNYDNGPEQETRFLEVVIRKAVLIENHKILTIVLEESYRRLAASFFVTIT